MVAIDVVGVVVVILDVGVLRDANYNTIISYCLKTIL